MNFVKQQKPNAFPAGDIKLSIFAPGLTSPSDHEIFEKLTQSFGNVKLVRKFVLQVLCYKLNLTLTPYKIYRKTISIVLHLLQYLPQLHCNEYNQMYCDNNPG